METYTRSRANSFLDGHGDLVIRVTKSTAPTGHVTYGSTRLVTRENSGRLKAIGKAGSW